MSRVSTRGDGRPTANMVRYYAEFAAGGFGLVITEGTYTDTAFAQAYPDQPGMVRDEHEAAWRRVVDRVHTEGAGIVLQLMHAGALSQCLERTAGPSAILPRGRRLRGYGGGEGAFRLPAAMTASDIAQAVDGFAGAARCAEAAGFDGVEIHGANGYLIDQFLTAYTNARTDRYGGAVERRVRIAVEILEAVRAAVSDRFLVGIRLSQGKVNDLAYRWPGGAEDAKAVFLAVSRAGASYIHFASEGRGFEHGCVLDDGTSLPRLARERTGLPVIANGGLHDPALAERILEEGHGDLVALGTGALANPDWPRRLACARASLPGN